MSEEPPVGNAALFAAMLSSKRGADRQLVETLTGAPVVQGDDRQQDDDAVSTVPRETARPPGDLVGGKADLEAERREAAELLLGDPKMAALVTGDTVQEIVKSAAEVAQTLAEGRAEQEAKRTPPVDFDGGPRGGLPEEPPQTHEQFLTGIFDNLKHGGPSGW